MTETTRQRAIEDAARELKLLILEAENAELKAKLEGK